MNLNTMLADATAPQTTTPATTGSQLAGQPPAPTGSEVLIHQLPFFVLLAVIFYFVLIRPQSQQRKRQQEMLTKIKPGDKVATTSGIVGVVIAVKDTTVTLKSFDAKMEVTKSSVTQILEGSTALAS